MLDKLPAELVVQIAEHAQDAASEEAGQPLADSMKALAQLNRHCRASLLPFLYDHLLVTSRSQLAGLAELLTTLPSEHPLDPASAILSLYLGPNEVLASASSESHYFSSVNYESSPSSRNVDQRWVYTAQILSRTRNLKSLVIWDGLLGPSPTSLDPPRYGLWALHQQCQLESLSLPFLWRGGLNLPSPTHFPQLHQLKHLDIVNSGLTIKDIRILATYQNLASFRWYYRPLGLIELELLLDTLIKESRLSGERGCNKPYISLAANNGKLAQMEGWLLSKLPKTSEKSDFDDSYLSKYDFRIHDRKVKKEAAQQHKKKLRERQNQIASSLRNGCRDLNRPESNSNADDLDDMDDVMDQYELDFLLTRRRAGLQGYAPGAAPHLPSRSGVEDAPSPAEATSSSSRGEPSQSTVGTERTSTTAISAATAFEPIMGGFPTEGTEEYFARRISEREKRLERERQQQQQRHAQEPSESGLSQISLSVKHHQQATEHQDPSWLELAAEWILSGRLQFDRRRWRSAIQSWESEWQYEVSASAPTDELPLAETLPTSQPSSEDSRRMALREEREAMLLSRLADL